MLSRTSREMLRLVRLAGCSLVAAFLRRSQITTVFFAFAGCTGHCATPIFQLGSAVRTLRVSPEGSC